MPQQGENGCDYLTDSRALIHPAGVSFRLLPYERRSTRNRSSSLLRFEADENISPSGAECAIYANSYNNDILTMIYISNLDVSTQASVLFLFPLYGRQRPATAAGYYRQTGMQSERLLTSAFCEAMRSKSAR